MSDSVCALSIAGSDSGGGAGIQADLRVFSRLGVFGTTAITAVTAQNLDGVASVMTVTPEVVRDQIHAVVSGFSPRAIKTGMLASRAIVDVVAGFVAQSEVPVVVDPVMVATSGARLLAEDAIAGYRDALAPHACLLTPNLDEAAVLLGEDTIERQHMEDAATTLRARLGCPVLLKGGHLSGDPVDILCHEGGVIRFAHARVPEVDTHGTGCMLSAAIAAHLARGLDLALACERGLAFVHDALCAAREVVPGRALAGIEAAIAYPGHITRLEPA